MRHAPAFLAYCLVIVLIGCGSGVTGTWTGTTEFDRSVLPNPTDPVRKALVEQVIKMSEESKVVMELKKDQTYSINTTGIPRVTPGPAGQPPILSTINRLTTGTWSQTGNTISLKMLTVDGQAVPDSNPIIVVTVSDDGKTLTMVPPSAGRDIGSSKVVFKR